jgi:hypothetical protein
VSKFRLFARQVVLLQGTVLTHFFPTHVPEDNLSTLTTKRNLYNPEGEIRPSVLTQSNNGGLHVE